MTARIKVTEEYDTTENASISLLKKYNDIYCCLEAQTIQVK
jgi:hypothetical protein